MHKTYWKEIRRCILKSKKRFFAIAVITALGVTVLTGIYAACQDMYRSADRFFDEQNLFDIRVLSTLGLTGADVEALQNLADVETAAGAYSETVHTEVKGFLKNAELTVLDKSGLNRPYLLAGSLPANSGEIAVTQAYLDETGKTLGDSLYIEEELDGAAPENAEENSGETAGGKTEDEVLYTPEAPAGAVQNPNKKEAASNFALDAETELDAEAETPNFLQNHYTITGVVLNPLDISSSGLTFRATSTAYTFYISHLDADFTVYTAVYLSLKGLREENCFSPGYEQSVEAMIAQIEREIRRQREEARYETVMAEAVDKLAEAENTMDDAFAEADTAFADAWAELTDAKKELLDGEAELTREEKDALQKLADARAQLENGKAELAAGEAQLAAGEAELAEGAAQLAEGKKALAEERAMAEAGFAEAEGLFAQKQAELDAAKAPLLLGIETLKAPFGEAWPSAEWAALVAAAGESAAAELQAKPAQNPDPAAIAAATAAQQNALAAALQAQLAALQSPNLDAAALTASALQGGLALGILQAGEGALQAQRSAFEAQKTAALQQLQAAEAQLAAGETELTAGRAELAEGRAQLNAGQAELSRGESQLNEEEGKALRELANAWQELAEGRQELAEGEAELLENEAEYGEQRQEAEQTLAEAYTDLQEIEMAQWYVQGRTALASYAGFKSDMSSIEAVGRAFPIVFLTVAILISLTTMARMVEEERSLIGTYKALGISSGAIYRKYLFYAFAACLLGGLVGDFFGFVLLPAFLINILQVMYTLPHIALGFDWLYGIGGILLFLASIVAATALACQKELRQCPAVLMRPKAPRAGARILLERFTPLWRRLRFLNKVTARNLFRYKKRLFMTVLGIAGCTALLLTGLAIRDSVTDLMPKQYEQVYRYDLMVVTDPDDHAAFVREAEADAAIQDFLLLQMDSLKLIAEDGKAETVQMLVTPDGADLERYIHTGSPNGETLQLDASGVLVTQNAAELLGVQPGGSLTLQTGKLQEAKAQVAGLAQNYLGNHLFITQAQYEHLFGPYQPNALLAHLSPAAGSQTAYAEGLLENPLVLSSISTEALKADFATNFTMINSVVYVFIVLAAGLAFVVLFTLSSTNISERVRELATIKVLGFYQKEVHAYINKETLILTLIGVGLGLPAGRYVSGLLTSALKMPSLYFAVYIRPSSYLLAAALALCFALLIGLLTGRTLDKIDMVEALKSAE